MTPEQELQGLHELFMPEAVSWQPHAVGWYVLCGVILLALAWWGYRRFRSFLANRYRRLALTELAALEGEWKVPSRRVRALAQVPVLLKRTALSAFPRAEVAGLSGDAWLAFLDHTSGGKAFTDGPGRVLREIAYAPAARLEHLPAESVTDLLRVARHWIKDHTRKQG